MKNKLREKVIASLILLVFAISNTTMVIAADLGMPIVRSQNPVTTLDINSEVQLKNGDSLVNLSLRDADIKQVLRMFADQAGMNIIFAPSVSGTVTMDMVNISLSRALDLVMATNNLTYRIKANTLIIAGKDEEFDLGGMSKDIILLPVKYVSAKSIADFLNKNIFSKKGINPGVSTKPVATVNPAMNELMIIGTREDALIAQRIIEQFDKKPQIVSFKVNHVTPAEMANLICSSLIPSFMTSDDEGSGGGEATGGAAGVPTGFASDTASSSSSSTSSFSSSSSGSSGGSGGEGISIGGGTLVCSIDQKTDEKDVGSLPFKNLTVTYFPTLGTIQIIGGSESQIEMIRDYITANDIKSPQAYLEVQIVTLSESGRKQFDNTWKYVSTNFSFNANEGGFGTANPIFLTGHGYTEPNTSGSGSKNPVTYARIHNAINLTYSMNYLIENGKGRVLANPRVLLTNGQQSTIDLTSDYVSKVTSQYLDSTGTGSSQVQKDYDIQSDNGIKVTITPFISPDGYVTLDISPEYSQIKEQVYSGSETGNKDLAATLLQRRNLELKGIRIKDGETLVIGGLIQETESKTTTKIPFLGDIPILGVLFRSTDTQREKEEMIIMLTPQILIDTEDAKDEATL